jgi:hypothetical protein
MTDQQLIHKANGVKRIKQSITNCDLPVSEVGTMFKSELSIFIYEIKNGKQKLRWKF